MKILIIGAGPIGCYTARLLKEKDKSLDVVVIEEHAEIGRPVHCAGLVSKDVFLDALIHLKDNMVVNHIDGAIFFFNRDNFKIKRRNSAVVINREVFDRELGSGLKIDFNTRFVGIEKNNSGYLVETDKRDYCADIVIGADGANSSFREIVGFKKNIKYLRGVQFRIKYSIDNKAFVRVYLRKPFFGWLIPESEEIVRVGIISNNPYQDLTEFVKEQSINGDILEKFAGIVPSGRCSTQNKNLFLVGDAACQIKPLTQGGIYYGMRCAEILVDCILNNKPRDYERMWRARFGREIEIGLKMRQIYNKLSYNNIKKIFDFLKNNVDLLEHFGDFENHSKVVSALVSNEGMKSLLGEALANIIKDIKLRLIS